MAGGRPKGSKKHPFADLLRIAVNEPCETDQNKKKLRAIAEKLADEAVKGEPWAIKEIADRLDGKPAQTIDTTIEEKPSLAAAATAELLERAASLVERIEGHADGTAEEAEGEGDDSGVRSVH